MPSTSGHTTGPPAENAYAVEPVAVAATTPSQPNVDSGRPSTSSEDLEHARAVDLLERGLVEGPAGADVAVRSDRRARRACRAPRRRSRRRSAGATASPMSSRSVSARNPTCPRLTPSSGTSRAARELGGAQDRAVAAEHDDQLERRQVARRPRPRPRARARRRPARARATASWVADDGLLAAAGGSTTSARRVIGAPPPSGEHGRGDPRRRAPCDRRRRRPPRSHRKNSTLPLGPGSGLRTTSRTSSPERRGRARDADARHSTRSAGTRTTPPEPSRSRPDLELRLDHEQQVGVRARPRRRARAAPG